MDLDSIECVSSSDGLDEDEIHLHHTLHPYSHSHHHPELSSSKSRTGSNNSAISITGPTATAPATSVHELLECPVCTNSMYPPIHQVCLSYMLPLLLGEIQIICPIPVNMQNQALKTIFPLFSLPLDCDRFEWICSKRTFDWVIQRSCCSGDALFSSLSPHL